MEAAGSPTLREVAQVHQLAARNTRVIRFRRAGRSFSKHRLIEERISHGAMEDSQVFDDPLVSLMIVSVVVWLVIGAMSLPGMLAERRNRLEQEARRARSRSYATRRQHRR